MRRERPWIVAATAHPGKFADVVEPVIGQTVTLPPALANVLERPVRVTDIESGIGALTRVLDGADALTS